MYKHPKFVQFYVFAYISGFSFMLIKYFIVQPNIYKVYIYHYMKQYSKWHCVMFKFENTEFIMMKAMWALSLN